MFIFIKMVCVSLAWLLGCFISVILQWRDVISTGVVPSCRKCCIAALVQMQRSTEYRYGESRNLVKGLVLFISWRGSEAARLELVILVGVIGEDGNSCIVG